MASPDRSLSNICRAAVSRRSSGLWPLSPTASQAADQRRRMFRRARRDGAARASNLCDRGAFFRAAPVLERVRHRRAAAASTARRTHAHAATCKASAPLAFEGFETAQILRQGAARGPPPGEFVGGLSGGLRRRETVARPPAALGGLGVGPLPLPHHGASYTPVSPSTGSAGPWPLPTVPPFCGVRAAGIPVKTPEGRFRPENDYSLKVGETACPACNARCPA
jgi:hypothetical protein